MPRARISSASLTASADALILPWLAPRAFAEPLILGRRQRLDGPGESVQEQVAIDYGKTVRSAGDGSCSVLPARSKTSRRSQPTTATLCRTPKRSRASASLDLRYVDIASFAHQRSRGYATTADSSSQPTLPASPQNRGIADSVSSGTRYSRRRSWKDALAEQVDGLTPEKAGRKRAQYIAAAEARLGRHAERLQRDLGRYKNKLLYDGQYRSLRRFILGLRRWDITAEDLRKYTRPSTDDEHWLLHAFAALDRSTYVRVNALTKPVMLQHDPRCQDYTEKLLQGVDSDGTKRIWFNWQHLDDKQRFYETVLIYMLEHKPGYAQDFVTILATDDSLPDSKFVILADALAHLAKLHVKGQYPPEQGWEATPDENTRKFVSTFINCTRFVDTAVYSQDLLHSLVLLANIPDLKKVYAALIESRTRLSVGTTLHYATAFGEAGEYRFALQCLERRLAAFKQTERERVVDSERFRWTCAAILRGSMREAKNYHETPGIVAAFVEFGVKMDLLLYDVVMHNAMEAGDFATAFKVYNALESNGLVPDKYTFSILLHGCTEQNDPAMFKAFAEFCTKKAKELNDPWLATDCLYYYSICEQNKPVESRNPTPVWRTYLDLFDLDPLEPFTRNGSRSMKDSIDQAALATESPKFTPTPLALYVVLQTEIQTVQPLSIGYLERLYKTFKRAISLNEAHPALISLSQTPMIWNTFLHAFCMKSQYASASAVIKDMTTYGTSPNVYSWNMFMQSFFKTGQVTAGERVFDLMRARGVDPDSYTYGVMVRGFAKAQLVDRIGETMQHISEEEQLDSDLLRALGQVQQRANLTAALEKGRSGKEKMEAEEAERKAKEEEKRFELPTYGSLFQSAIRFRPAAHWDNGGVEDADDFMEPDEEAQETQEAQPSTAKTDVGYEWLKDGSSQTASDSRDEQTQSRAATETELAFESLLGSTKPEVQTQPDETAQDGAAQIRSEAVRK